MRQGSKENAAREPLHFLDGSLHLSPVGDGALQPLELFLGERDTGSLTLHFARPLITRSAGAGSPILGIALTDPSHFSQARFEARVFGLPRVQLRYWKKNPRKA